MWTALPGSGTGAPFYWRRCLSPGLQGKIPFLVSAPLNQEASGRVTHRFWIPQNSLLVRNGPSFLILVTTLSVSKLWLWGTSSCVRGAAVTGAGVWTPAAYCRNSLDGQWYSYDDSTVDPLPEAEVTTRGAYILFYQKRNSIPCWSASSSMRGGCCCSGRG